jgi:exopolyphosphatase/guanosine-5'-triphosphate,3'-diphosphate pyrophosphatase
LSLGLSISWVSGLPWDLNFSIFSTMQLLNRKSNGNPGTHRRKLSPKGSGQITDRNREEISRKAVSIAALDLGTNNCRLMIARPKGNGFTIIDGFSKVVRLGEGLVFSGKLSDQAMDRTITTLTTCQEKIAKRGVVLGRYVATEACRQAANGEVFLERVRVETGLKLEMISSQEEAQLTFNGCLPLLRESAEPYALTFDVGGGSAEILLVDLSGSSSKILDCISLPYGVVTLTERYSASEISSAKYQNMVREIFDALQPFEQKHQIREKISAGQLQVLGTAGTVTTIAGIHMELKKYNRTAVDGTWLDSGVVTDISKRLVTASFSERAALGCIGESRAELVVAGCGVLQAICEMWPAPRIRVADRGVREGLLLSLVKELA